MNYLQTGSTPVSALQLIFEKCLVSLRRVSSNQRLWKPNSPPWRRKNRRKAAPKQVQRKEEENEIRLVSQRDLNEVRNSPRSDRHRRPKLLLVAEGHAVEEVRRKELPQMFQLKR